MSIDANMIIDDVIERHRETLPVFLRFGMDCYGCSMARFETVADGAAIYGIDVQDLLRALNDAVSQPASVGGGRQA